MDRKSASQILNSRKLVSKVGKVTLRVTSVSPFQREDGTMTTIVNFNGMTPYQLEKAKEHFSAGEYDEAINLNISASQLSGRFVPSKGEIVDVEIAMIENKDGVNILVVDTIVPRQAEVAPSISGFTADDEEIVDEENLVPNSNVRTNTRTRATA